MFDVGRDLQLAYDAGYKQGRFDEMVETLISLPVWIPCSEHLPKVDEEVFVYLFGDSPYLAWYDGHEWQTEDFTVDDDERPTAWKPLPKPWKGEGDD